MNDRACNTTMVLSVALAVAVTLTGCATPGTGAEGREIALKLIDTKAAYTRTLPEVRDQLSQQMRTERATMLRRAYLAELLKQHPPVLNELALSSLFDNSRK